LLTALPAFVLAGCSIGGSSSSTPSAHFGGQPTSASGTPRFAGTTRTVLAQLGLNMHSQPATDAPVVGVLGQGARVTVLDYQAAGGGWFRVQGQSVTGWIVADPVLTAMGALTSYSSDTRGFSALYPQSWTFAEEANETVFRPQSGGMDSIVVRAAATPSAFGPQDPKGYTAAKSDQVVVCGYTGELNQYQRTSSAPSTPQPGSAAQGLGRYAEIRLVFDAAHAMSLAFNYATDGELQVFKDFYNSISFPFPLCQAPASPMPGPT
jgi:uncharacterized protein YgiM (DUF1202 family)